jgi:2'-5' RNA ligase
MQEKLYALLVLEIGTMTPREFFLYQSQLSPKGSKYTKLARFGLQPWDAFTN